MIYKFMYANGKTVTCTAASDIANIWGLSRTVADWFGITAETWQVITIDDDLINGRPRETHLLPDVKVKQRKKGAA